MIVTGATKLVSLQELYNETGWESLEVRRKKHKLILYYKMCNDLLPIYLSSLVPPFVNSISRYHLRSEMIFRQLMQGQLYTINPSFRLWSVI